MFPKVILYFYNKFYSQIFTNFNENFLKLCYSHMFQSENILSSMNKKKHIIHYIHKIFMLNIYTHIINYFAVGKFVS